MAKTAGAILSKKTALLFTTLWMEEKTMKQEKENPINVVVATSGHRWDKDGERCLNCGDKDWYADKFCSMSKLKKEQK